MVSLDDTKHYPLFVCIGKTRKMPYAQGHSIKVHGSVPVMRVS
ncbi:MAG: hypothetical protein V7K20_28140 [Nostoc sp.]